MRAREFSTNYSVSLNEFSPGMPGGNGGDEKSYLLQLADDLGNALYGTNKNKQEIENVMSKIRAVGGNVKISWNNDSTMNVVMYHPIHFKQGYLIRLVGQGDQGVAEGSLNELANTSLKVKQPKDFVNVNDRKQVTWKVMKFKSGKDTYLINFTMQHPPAFGKKSKSNWNAVNVAFGIKEPQNDYSFGDEINTDLTARNKNQFLIYSTVINAVRKFITEYNTEIDEIIMQGAGERQQAMYQRFFRSAGKYFPGWHYNGKHSLVRDVPRQPVKKVREQGVAENFADGRNPVKFTVTTPDGYAHSFQITLAVHGKHVGHFNFVRGADTDDVNNEVEVESRWQGQGYGKLLLMKAIDVANNHGLDFQQDIRGITDAQQNVYDSLENAGSIVTPGDGFWFLTPQGEQELNGLNENFADGKKPGRKGLAKRVGVNCKQPISKLRSIASNSSGEKQRMAHWCANMKSGKQK